MSEDFKKAMEHCREMNELWKDHHEKDDASYRKEINEKFDRIEKLVLELKEEFKPVRDTVISWKGLVEDFKNSSDTVKQMKAQMVVYSGLFAIAAAAVAQFIVKFFK